MFGRKKEKQPKRITALCLGGGGARGFAHIGAIKAMEEAGVTFDMVVGTSAGALVGALYAAGISADTMIRYASTLSFKDLHNGILITPNDPMRIARIVTDLIGATEFDRLKRKFAAVAVDIVQAKQAVLDSGSVSIAVAASCAVPVLYRPVSLAGKHLCDGGLLNNIPADVCRMLGATRVVTVDVHPTRGGGTSSTGLFDVLKATMQIVLANASVNGLRHSDVIIAPDTAKFSSVSKTGWEEMIETGYRAAKAKIADI
ncbi:MAG: hypothetical protein HFE46_04230 [Clostridia bacterium]|jgi:NTE family protein|nr:hypothetical protein [Clostridia bacterium]